MTIKKITTLIFLITFTINVNPFVWTHPTSQVNVNVPESFETEHFSLRFPEKNDAQEWLEAFSETRVELSNWWHWPKNIDINSVRKTRKRLAKRRKECLRREQLVYLVFDKESGELAGAVGFHRVDWDIPKFEIGGWARKKYMGKGYAFEIGEAATNFAFDVLGANRVEMLCNEKNAISQKVIARLGFEFEGKLRNARLNPDGTLGNVLVFAKIREEEQNSKQKPLPV